MYFLTLKGCSKPPGGVADFVVVVVSMPIEKVFSYHIQFRRDNSSLGKASLEAIAVWNLKLKYSTYRFKTSFDIFLQSFRKPYKCS
jgi:hypothetical protein